MSDIYKRCDNHMPCNYVLKMIPTHLLMKGDEFERSRRGSYRTAQVLGFEALTEERTQLRLEVRDLMLV